LQEYRVVRQGKAAKSVGKDEAGCAQIIYGQVLNNIRKT